MSEVLDDDPVSSDSAEEAPEERHDEGPDGHGDPVEGADVVPPAVAPPDRTSPPRPGSTTSEQASIAAAPLPRSRHRMRRTWPQRLLIGFNLIVVMACAATAVGLRYGYDTVGDLNRVITVIQEGPSVVTQEEVFVGANGQIQTFSDAAPGEVGAENFLLVGVDARGCQSSNPQYAGAFAGGSDFRNTDTIIVVRTDPAVGQAAMLSFPRDLWVKGPNSNSRAKLNSFFSDPQDPNALITVIEQNFGIPINHYVAIDFCAFRDLVNAVGPIRIPFAFPTRDKNTGLNIDKPSCWAFDGDAALAYARSRHYEWQDEDGDWHLDETGDYGRQSRQQDFMRRVLRKAIDSGARDPGKLRQLVRIGLEYITVDQYLTAQNVYDLGRSFDSLDPAAIRSFSIVGRGVIRDDIYIELFDLESQPNADIVSVFSGKARLAAEEPVPGEAAAGPGDAVAVPSAPADPAAPAERDVPEVSVDSVNEVTEGSVLPPDDPTCT